MPISNLIQLLKTLSDKFSSKSYCKALKKYATLLTDSIPSEISTRNSWHFGLILDNYERYEFTCIVVKPQILLSKTFVCRPLCVMSPDPNLFLYLTLTIPSMLLFSTHFRLEANSRLLSVPALQYFSWRDPFQLLKISEVWILMNNAVRVHKTKMLKHFIFTIFLKVKVV